jgi:hypothetical protein
MEDGSNECYFDPEEYPFYQTIKKLLYAFGDTLKNNHKTIIFFHEFIKKWLIGMSKLITECEFKKILEHLYSYEYSKYHTYKRLKVKNNFNSNLGDLMVDGEDDVLIDLDDKKDFIDNLFEEKDNEYYENLNYQDERTKDMTQQEYIDYNICRTQSFLIRGKKVFLNYMNNIIPNIPFELKDQNNLELITFIMKEIIHKIVKQAIKSKNPDNKLFVLKYPLLVSDVEDSVNQELETIDSFFEDFHNSLYLIKEFKKKRLSKDNNKNVKIKKDGNNLSIIIKKYIFLDDSEAFKKMRIIAEDRVSELVKNLGKNRKKEKHIAMNIDEIGNYYEYFLMRDYFKIISRDKIEYTQAGLRKINKKYFLTKLAQWLNYTNIERDLVINEYNNI